MVKFAVKSANELQYIAQRMAKFLFPGAFLALNGDLGAGKTTFTQGLAKGLGVEEEISSPTFTIIKQYDELELPLYHMDVYRLERAEEMEDLGYEEYFYGNGVTVVEWAENIKELWPKEYLEIRFNYAPEGRILEINPKGRKYEEIIEELTGYDYTKRR